MLWPRKTSAGPYFLALTHAQEGRPPDAAAAFQATLELALETLPALLRLSEIQLTADRGEAARESFERALALDTYSAAIHFRLGRAAAAQSESEAAATRAWPTASSGSSTKRAITYAGGGFDQVWFPDPLNESLSALATGAAADRLRATRACAAASSRRRSPFSARFWTLTPTSCRYFSA